MMGVFNDYLPLMQTFKKREKTDALAAGLLQKMHHVKFIGAVAIIKPILPATARRHGRESCQVSLLHFSTQAICWITLVSYLQLGQNANAL